MLFWENGSSKIFVEIFEFIVALSTDFESFEPTLSNKV